MFKLVKISFLFIFFSQAFFASGQKRTKNRFKWKRVATLPLKDESGNSLGVAGPVQGISNGALVVAGGSNFPKNMPWHGGTKVYYNKVYVLEYRLGEYVWNDKITDTLPEPVSYSGCASTQKGIVYVGGQLPNGLSQKCYLVNFDSSQNKLNFKRLPDLPLPLTGIGVANIGNKVYIAGGDDDNRSSQRFFCLDLDSEDNEWIRLPDIPVPIGNSVVIAQNYKGTKQIFVIGGRSKISGAATVFHSTVFAFDPLNNIWRACANISDVHGLINLAAGSGVPINDNQILITGGDNGDVFGKIEKLNFEIEKTKDSIEKEKLISKRNRLNDHHKGFDRRLLLYYTDSDKWEMVGKLPFQPHVTTTNVIWDDRIVISNGEKRPGVRAPDVILGESINRIR